MMETAQTDPRTFTIRRNGRKSEASIERKQVTSWAPSAQTDITLVTLDNGKTMPVNCQFREFHAWVIGPALERDQRLKETLSAKKELSKGKETPKARKAPLAAKPTHIEASEDLITIP
jgi:hypothetical protein